LSTGFTGEKERSNVLGKLDGKTVIVTGAGSGSGRAIALLFAEERARVVINCRTSSDGEEAVEMIKKDGGEATYVRADVTKPSDVKRTVDTAVTKYGKLDIMVNNAGINPHEGPITECEEKVFDRIIAINLKGVWLGMKYAIRSVLKTGGGTILNINSVCAFKAPPSISSYASSKGGVVALTRAVAVGFAPHNIRINCLSPSPFITPLLLTQWTEEELAGWTRLTPRRRLADVDEVAKSALFLVSDDSAHIFAQSIIMDGGIEADLHVDLQVGR
jgi:NAD(P)-dependent dehydrogenase (short-subunit alcohol dehydrogenase family)